mmetsp:Transcript_10673/g.30085  ORF Transcript_10673/g.30085 Transcript_10673/m.30085 type:complete len:443 (-) Transcript_10673:102-1430(-)
MATKLFADGDAIVLTVTTAEMAMASGGPLGAFLGKVMTSSRGGRGGGMEEAEASSRKSVGQQRFRYVTSVKGGTLVEHTSGEGSREWSGKLLEMFKRWFPWSLSRDVIEYASEGEGEGGEGATTAYRSHETGVTREGLKQLARLMGKSEGQGIKYGNQVESCSGFEVAVTMFGDGSARIEAGITWREDGDGGGSAVVSMPGMKARVSRRLFGLPTSLSVVEEHDFDLASTRQSEEPNICVESYLPSYLSPLLSSSKVQVGNAGARPLLDVAGVDIALSPGKGSSLLEVCLNPSGWDKGYVDGGQAPPSAKLLLSYRKSFPSVFSLPADRSAGLYFPSSYVYLEGHRSLGQFTDSLRVQFPLPDASMPYNACIITCTVFALCVGVTLKNLGYVIKPAKGEAEGKRKAQKRLKLLVNLVVLVALVVVVLVADSETRLYIQSLVA